jgi:hypothetical protein
MSPPYRLGRVQESIALAARSGIFAAMAVPEILLVGLGALLVLAIIWLSVRVFRHGSSARFITLRPFVVIALYTFGLLSVDWGIEWMTDVPDRGPFALTLIAAAAFFAVAVTIWFVGFFYGRWRRERHAGVLSGRR